MSNISKEIDYKAPMVDGAAEVKAWAGPRATFKFYGIAGPYGEIDVYGHFTADTTLDPWWTLGWGVDCILGIDISMICAGENPQFGVIPLVPEKLLVDAGGPFSLSDIIFPPFTPDPGDTVPLNVVQTIPNDGAASVPPSTTIKIYFDDEVNPSTINDVAITIKDSAGIPYFGTYSGELSTAGDTIMTFVPYNEFPSYKTIIVTLEYEGGITDDGNNTLSKQHIFTFNTGNVISSPADLGFEQSHTGWIFTGDGSIIPALDSLGPSEGISMAGISTGSVFDIGAVSNATSTLTSGPIDVPSGTTTLTFDYDFISAEFDEYVGSQYDDNFAIAVVGPLDSFTGLVTSVNIVGIDASIPIIFTVSELNGSDHTDWATYNVYILKILARRLLSHSPQRM